MVFHGVVGCSKVYLVFQGVPGVPGVPRCCRHTWCSKVSQAVMGKSQLFTPKSLTSQVSAGDFKSPSHERNDLSHSQVTSLLYCTQHNLCTKNRLSYLRKHIATVSATGFGTGTNRKLHCKNVSISRVCSCSLDLLGDIESPARENTRSLAAEA